MNHTKKQNYPSQPHPIRKAQSAGYDAGVKAKRNPKAIEKRRRGASRRLAFLLGFLRGANPSRRPAYTQSERSSYRSSKRPSFRRSNGRSQSGPAGSPYRRSAGRSQRRW